MLGSASIIAILVSGIVCFLFPIVILIFFKKKENLNLKPFFVGMIIFTVFVLVFERFLHMVVLGNNLIESPIIFAVYGALAAGIFEESGRFIAFKTVLKNNHEWKDGLAYGIGHGGIEAILISAIPNIVYAVNSLLTNSVSSEIQANSYEILLILVERVFAFGIQLGLTMTVLYAVRYRKNIYLLIAVLLHAIVDFPAVLYQKQIITSMSAVEGFAALCFVISVLFMLKTKNMLSREESRSDSVDNSN